MTPGLISENRSLRAVERSLSFITVNRYTASRWPDGLTCCIAFYRLGFYTEECGPETYKSLLKTRTLSFTFERDKILHDISASLPVENDKPFRTRHEWFTSEYFLKPRNYCTIRVIREFIIAWVWPVITERRQRRATATDIIIHHHHGCQFFKGNIPVESSFCLTRSTLSGILSCHLVLYPIFFFFLGGGGGQEVTIRSLMK